MKITRVWAMPSSNTFQIPPVAELLHRVCYGADKVIVDPFARNNTWGTVTNDLDPDTDAHHHMDALEFLRSLESVSADVVLFDPPYSPRQVSECYKKLGMTVNMQTTQASFWGNMKREVSRVLKEGGKSVTCGWNSGGIGKSNGMEIVEVLLVPHGGWHNDTIVTVEKKL